MTRSPAPAAARPVDRLSERLSLIGDARSLALCEAALRRLGVSAARRLRPDQASSLGPEDSVIVTGEVEGTGELIAGLANAGTRTLCTPALAALAATQRPDAFVKGSSVACASRLSFTPAVRRALAAIGEVREFEARLCLAPVRADAAFWTREAQRGGFLADPGAEILDLLQHVLGGLQIESYSDDGLGGVEAEALVRLSGPRGGRGCLLLSRLRPLGAVLSLQGTEGRAEVDLTAARAGRTARFKGPEVAAEAARIGAWLRGDLAPSGLFQAVAAARTLRTQLVQPWEARTRAAGSGPLAGRRVLVVGATGFIGSRLVEVLAAEGAVVTAAARNLARAARIARLPVRLIELDLADPRQAAEAVKGQEIVFSLAHDLHRSGARNVETYQTLADAAAKAGVRRFVHTSSIAAYDDWPRGDLSEESPRDVAAYEYKDTKRAIERDLARRAAAGQFTAAVLQPTIVYGPFSRLWTDRYAEWLTHGDIVLPAEGRGLCNGVYIDDLVDALIRAAGAGTAGAEAYIVSGPRPFAWRELLEAYAQGLPGKIVGEPVGRPEAPSSSSVSPIGKALAALLSLQRKSPFRDAIAFLRAQLGEQRLAAIRRRLERRAGSVLRPGDHEPDLFCAQGVCSIEKARAELGYAPRFDLPEALAPTLAYIEWRYGRAESTMRSSEIA